MKKFTDAPPAYSASVTNNPPRADPAEDNPNVSRPNYKYTPLTKFTIGKHTTPEPLVSIVETKGHLALLHAFAEMKNSVQQALVVHSSLDSVPLVAEDKEKKWTWFVGLAVERFDLWCRSLKISDSSKPWHVVLPPVDVLMVWHAYMLNPRWYAEDCMRIPQCQTLRAFEPHFLRLLSDPSFHLAGVPSNERYAFWVRTTHSAGFDPLEEARLMTNTKKVVMCPNKCPGGTEVDYMNREGTGYFQKNFRAICARPGCPSGRITKETLALRKLAEDLADRDESSSLPGTFFTSSPADKEKGKRIKQKIYDEANLAHVNGVEKNKDALVVPIMQYCSYSLPKLRERMGAKDQPILMERILSAYNDDKAYSVELIGAVLRQGSFVGKMHELQWTSPGFFDQYADELALHHALARYHAFLDLMSSSPASFFVPTLDIDLVWHTHQLIPGKYYADCKEYLERFIDHDDKVESMKLSSAFDITSRAWKERFHVHYTHCGCPIPGDSIGQRLSRMVGIHSRPPASSSHLVPYGRPDALAATHASDHNAVRIVSNNLTAHRLAMMRQEILTRKKMNREQELANKKAAKKKLEDRMEELKAAKARGPGLFVLKSNSTPPSRPPLRSNNDDDGNIGYKTQRYCHGTPFLLPVPLFFGGGHGGAGGGCVSDGHTVSSVGACSSAGGGLGGCGGGSSSAGCGNNAIGGCDGAYNGSSSGGCGGGDSSGGVGCGGGSGGGGGSACGSSGGCGGGCGGGGGGGGCGGC